jgi:hypothetical protein
MSTAKHQKAETLTIPNPVATRMEFFLSHTADGPCHSSSLSQFMLVIRLKKNAWCIGSR